jgi:hypothetical protein
MSHGKCLCLKIADFFVHCFRSVVTLTWLPLCNESTSEEPCPKYGLHCAHSIPPVGEVYGPLAYVPQS